MVNNENHVICPECSSELPAGTKFCTSCGAEVPQQNISQVSEGQDVFCPECSAKVTPGTKFCTECGAKVEGAGHVIDTDGKVTCPKCGTELPSNAGFCTECGCEISPQTVQEKVQLDDDPVDSVKKTGKGFLRGVGGFLDKAAASIDDATQTGPNYQRKSYSENPQPAAHVESVKGTGKGLLRDVGGFIDKAASDVSNKKETETGGYLVCEKCGGYYELEEGESPEDFESCGCGGHLKYVKNLEN
jgi:DNA-directed RNA polymerase subunit RPC12/RpoP